MNAIVPIPRCDVSVRPATPDDVPFIERLQRENRRSVGFLALSWIEGKINKGQVLVARASRPCNTGQDTGETPVLLGYIISQDKYLNREELGLVVQLCVAPGSQRKLVGATLLKAAFDRASYGCLLFCCWCAQDIEANRFWESMGFVPLAYRGGSEKKNRVHIFWQRRIREGDTTTRWWYPTETRGGAMGEPRLVFPIPPDRHWSDELPVIRPNTAARQLAGPREKQPAKAAPAVSRNVRDVGGLRFVLPAAAPSKEKPKREKKPKAKHDPELVAKTRELRDRWLERVNAGEALLEPVGKYDVTRVLPGPAEAPASVELKALPNAA